MFSPSHVYDTVVIGAGMAGARCAQNLAKAGLDVVILEKSRGVGGRMSTRRVSLDAEETIADHGAQYITVKGDRFRQFVDRQLKLGTMAEWTRHIHVLDDTGLHEGDYDDRVPRYCCPEGMTAVVKQMCTSLNVVLQTRVSAVQATAGGWQVTADDDRRFWARSLVIALPAPQILALLGDWLTADYPLHAPLSSAQYVPCIAVMAGYGSEALTPSWRGVKCQGDDRVVWVSLDSSKRSRQGANTSSPIVVVHSTPQFAESYLESERDELQAAGRLLIERAAERLGDWLATPDWMQVHRWRYSLPVETVGMASLGMAVPAGDRVLPLICAGDWCAGPKVEGAFISGEDAAVRGLAMLDSLRTS
ncbi:MAG: FAD-dependent oxidoreductase [Cyanobacteria bacterium P01_E01_bin.45]